MSGSRFDTGWQAAPCAFLSKRWTGCAAGLLGFAVLACYLCLPLYPTLSISSNGTGRELWSEPVQSGEKFVIRYTHSVANSEVDEIIRVEGDQLVIDSTKYESFGAGLPYSTEGKQSFSSHDGKMTIDNLNLAVRNLDLFIGQVIANHRLIIHGKTFPLSSLSEPGTSIRFSIIKENRLMRLKRSVFHAESS